MIGSIKKINRVKGELKLPGDKSISHRSIIFSSLANGVSNISNLLESDDIFSTINCFRNLGCKIDKQESKFVVHGKGAYGFIKPTQYLDAGNSGTTARLISGVLAMQKFESYLKGDSSLSKRPMRRITEPLSKMGSLIKLSETDTLPAHFFQSKNLKAIKYEMPVASAQVKSAILLAGIHLDEETLLIDKFLTRDHTERMLGCEVNYTDDQKIISVSSKNYPTEKEYVIPSDISTAAFFIVLTLLSKNGELYLRDISLNPSRTGIIKILQQMGAEIKIENQRTIAGEDLGDLYVKSSSLKNVQIDEDIIPNIIDEIPILAIAGIFAEGDFVIRGAEELRYKESDRIKSICNNFIKLGLEVTEFKDGFSVEGKIKFKNVLFESYHDHRIAMAFAILSSLEFDEAQIKDFDCVAISNPNFIEQLHSITE